MGAVQSNTLVVVVNFNTGHWLQSCIESLGRSTITADIVVVDNASQDDSLGFLSSHPEVHLIRNDTNLGFSKACNQGAACKSGRHEYLLFLNPDTDIQSDALAGLLHVMLNQKAAGLVGALVVDEDGREQRACRRYLPTPAKAAISFSGLSLLPFFQGVNISGPMPVESQEVEAVSGAAMLVRSSAFNAISGFDEQYFLHCEDLDLFFRLRQAGHQIWLAPKALVVHAKGVSQRSNRLRSERHKHRSMIRFLQQHHAKSTATWMMALLEKLVWFRFAMFAPWWWLKQRSAQTGRDQ